MNTMLLYLKIQYNINHILKKKISTSKRYVYDKNEAYPCLKKNYYNFKINLYYIIQNLAFRLS